MKTPSVLPLWVRKFLTDAIETGVAAVLFIQFALPASVDEGLKVGAMLGAAVVGALISAARRAFPDFKTWLEGQLGTGAD